jgi:hypothetical protein
VNNIVDIVKRTEIAKNKKTVKSEKVRDSAMGKCDEIGDTTAIARKKMAFTVGFCRKGEFSIPLLPSKNVHRH